MGINEYLKVGNQIKEARIKIGLTQKEVSEKLNMPKSTYANYENNHREPSLDIVQRIAEVLDIPVDELFMTSNTKKMLRSLSDDQEKRFNELEELIAENEKQNLDSKERHHLITYYYDALNRTGRDAMIEILSYLNSLNDIGILEAAKRVEELTYIEKYKKE